MKRYSVQIFLSILVFSIFGIVNAAQAQTDSLKVSLSPDLINKGYTAVFDSQNFKVGIVPGLVSEPVTVELKKFDTAELPLPENLQLVSDGYVYDILRQNSAAANPLIVNKPFNLALKYDSANFFRKKIYFWNGTAKEWQPLPSTADYQSGYIRAYTHLPFSRVAVFEDKSELEGKASWYRSSKYRFGAACNNYPMGTKLRVKNVDSNKSVDVEVVSTGPFSPERVIDLTSTAFKQIELAWKGVARVQVIPLNDEVKVLGTDTAVLTVKPPTITAKAAIAINENTGQILYEKNANTALPMASLTKIMTAVVFLETNTPWDKVVTYTADDNAIGSKLYVSPGETMLVKDLFYAALVGSANNATKALARSTGLSDSEFVRRMNAKASAWGLSATHFNEVTGLDPANVTSAADYARLATNAFKDIRILQATTAPVYTFTTINTGKSHTLKNKDKMISSSWFITGLKTGYLDEAQYCLVVKARKDKTSSPDVLTVVLGSATDSQRYAETKALITYGLATVK